MPMIDVPIPTTDGGAVRLARDTEPDPELRRLLAKLKIDLPTPPPKISAAQIAPQPPLR